MTTANVTQFTQPTIPIVFKSITISDIELQTRKKRRLTFNLPVAPREFTLEVSVGATTQWTQVARETENHTSWKGSLYFDGDDHSNFVIKVHQTHNESVWSLHDTIGGVLRELKDGVTIQTLSTHTSSGSGLSGHTIKFELAVKPSGSSNASELQARDAVAMATRTVTAVNSMPGAVDLVTSATQSGPVIVTQVQTFGTTWDILLKRLKLFDAIVTEVAEIHPYVSMAWSVISVVNKALINQRDRDGQISRLASTMSDVFDFVEDAGLLKKIESHMSNITPVIQQVTECAYFIAEYSKKTSFFTRTVKYTFSDINTKIADYDSKLRELKTKFLEGVTLQSGITVVQTELTVVRIMNAVEHIQETVDLKDMPYARGARYSEDKGCLPGTRETLLREVCDTLNNPAENAPRVCLLTGVAGSGKSTVAHTIAKLYDGQLRLGSSYCFASSDVARRNPTNLFSTIARDLADIDSQYRSALWSIVKGNQALRMTETPAEQIKRFIVEPSKTFDGIGPIVVVIDALDESGEPADRARLLTVVSEYISKGKLPTNLRFLITSRPENDIVNALSSYPHVIHKQMGDVSAKTVNEDIEKFVYHSLHPYRELESSWPRNEWCRLLVQRSEHLFQWAATACNFIRDAGGVGLTPDEALENILKNDQAAIVDPLDGLYRTILDRLFQRDDTRHRFQAVMSIILALREPLSLSTLLALQPFGDIPDARVRAILRPMASLLDGVLVDDKPIQVLHASFRDFLLDHSRSSALHVSIQPHHSLFLGRALLACMRDMLRFNICDLNDTPCHNTDIPDLLSRVNMAIPPHLSYSCLYYMDHLQHTNPTPDLLHEITQLFKTSFPYWLEVISLLSHSSVTPILSALQACTIQQHWSKSQEIASLATEAFRFIQLFAPVLKESTPHLYLSAMPQTPSDSPLWELWSNRLIKHAFMASGHAATWPADFHVLQGHNRNVMSVAYSPDGKYIASGSQDGTIRVWNATTGQSVADPFEEHRDYVRSVAYSPDGKYIVSGSDDKTIRVWNATTGQTVADPFEGHTGWVMSVAYSPDGQYVVSGSSDRTVRVWDATTGQAVTGPFEGHTDNVNCVAYSPDGKYIVSGSNDRTVRVWGATTGWAVTYLFEGHTDYVNCIACSPDGKYIVSGSCDRTVRVWDATTGQAVTDPFKGDMDYVNSIAYSSDGKYIVLGSDDKTTRVLDATTGQTVAGPFEGHTGYVTCVAYSPDGKYIVSGSDDKTVRVWDITISQDVIGSFGRNEVHSVACSPDSKYIVSGSYAMGIWVWDATTGQTVVGPFDGDTYEVTSVAYSPDGKHIVSGSNDNTIRVWDVTTGQTTIDSFEGHTDSVMSVAYSPDSKYIVSGSNDRTVRVWDATTGQAVTGPFEGHIDNVNCVAYSPDGKYIVSGSNDRTVRVWGATTGVTDPFKGHTYNVTSVACSPDGKYIVSGSEDYTIRVWDATTGQTVAGPFEEHTDCVRSVAYSPDGKYIVSGSDDNTIRVWDLITGQTMAFQGHTSQVNSVSWSPDGTYIVTGSDDFSIKLWMVEDFSHFGNLEFTDGWVECPDDGTCLFWVIPSHRQRFSLPIHLLTISSQGVYEVDFDFSLFGKSWASCWNRLDSSSLTGTSLNTSSLGYSSL